MEALLDSLDDAQYLLLNSTILPLQGSGADSFFLNESLPDDQTLLDFETLGDYARDDHQFQKHARKQEDPKYVSGPTAAISIIAGRAYRSTGYSMHSIMYADLRTQARS